MIFSQYGTNQKLVPFTMIDGFEEKTMFSPSTESHQFFGQQLIIRLDKDQSMNFYDIDGDFHQLKRQKEGQQSILIYNNFLIYDAGELTITNP